MTKTQFYAYRDKVYKMIEDATGGQDYAQLPGDPFSQFSHKAIKDSPFKNYSAAKTSFDKLVQDYFPAVYSQLQLDNGNKKTEQKRTMDINLGEDINVEETLRGITSDTIRNIENKVNSGVPLSSTEQTVWNAYLKLQGELRRGAKKQIKTDIFSFIEEHLILIIIVIVVIILIKKGKL